jgi:hypothetical protein
MGDPIVELPLGDPKRLAVFQNPPMRILSLNKLIILVTELYESELNIRY